MKKQNVFTVALAATLACCLVACGSKPVTVNGLTATTNTTELAVGDTTQMQVAFTSDSDVTDEALAKATADLSVVWASSDEAVATVDASGLVTAIAPGEADITASTKAGENELSASCHISVAVPEASPTADDIGDEYNIALYATPHGEGITYDALYAADHMDIDIGYVDGKDYAVGELVYECDHLPDNVSITYDFPDDVAIYYGFNPDDPDELWDELTGEEREKFLNESFELGGEMFSSLKSFRTDHDFTVTVTMRLSDGTEYTKDVSFHLSEDALSYYEYWANKE